MKDPEEVVNVCDRPVEVEASLEAVKKALKLC
jgi:hypothetical protein